MSNAQRLAFVCPRFAEGGTVGGAETLLRNLATRAAAAGRNVSFLTTCATSHVSWQNVLPPGARRIDGVEVRFFPVDEDRNEPAFLQAQQSICSRRTSSKEDESVWLENNVHSQALYRYLRDNHAQYDRILMGPYLFGLVYRASEICPQKTVLVPCLHDEPFAYLDCTRDLFARVSSIMFNSHPEQELALHICNLPPGTGHVVGMGLEPFECNRQSVTEIQKAVGRPYIVYSGRREPMKGTPLLLDYLATFRQRTGRDLGIVLTGTGPIEAPAPLSHALLDLGFVSEERKHAAMAGAVAFCHPSVNESLGIVLLEAWLAGTPGLVHAGSAVLQDHCRRSGGGLWFRTYPEFEEELLLILDRSGLSQSMADAGHDYVVREYSWDSITARMFAALDG